MGKNAGDVAGTLFGLLLLGATIYGGWHGSDRHGRSWGFSLMPPVAWYYAAESTWHTDGRVELCTKIAQCRGALEELGAETRDYDACLRKTEIALTGESSARRRAFERLTKKAEKMTCEELAEWLRESSPGQSNVKASDFRGPSSQSL